MKKLALVFAIACGVTGTAFAQRPEWPAKPIKLLVPFGAGGAADVARGCSPSIGRRWASSSWSRTAPAAAG